MKRIVLFLTTNLAIVLVLSVSMRLLGVEPYLNEQGLNLSALLVFAAVIGMGGSFISLAISKWSAKRMTGAVPIETPTTPTEIWLVETVRRQAEQVGIGMQYHFMERDRRFVGHFAVVVDFETDPIRRIELGMHATMHYLAENRHIFNLFQFAATEKAFAPTLRQGAEVGAADTMRHIKEGMAEGRFADADPWIVTQAVIGVTNELARRCIFARNDPPDQVADAAVQFCLRGLLGCADIPSRADLVDTAGDTDGGDTDGGAARGGRTAVVAGQ